MRDDQRFEIERAFDLLPHVVGASWAVTWYRLNEIKKPSREEFRNNGLRSIFGHLVFLLNKMDHFYCKMTYFLHHLLQKFSRFLLRLSHQVYLHLGLFFLLKFLVFYFLKNCDILLHLKLFLSQYLCNDIFEEFLLLR